MKLKNLLVTNANVEEFVRQGVQLPSPLGPGIPVLITEENNFEDEVLD